MECFALCLMINLYTFQTLANESLLLPCLRRMLSFESKFTREAFRIISNLAARSQTWIQIGFIFYEFTFTVADD